MNRCFVPVALALSFLSMAGCQTMQKEPDRENILTLDGALAEIRTSLIKFRPKTKDDDLGLMLTDVQVVLKIEEGHTRTIGGSAGIPVTVVLMPKST